MACAGVWVDVFEVNFVNTILTQWKQNTNCAVAGMILRSISLFGQRSDFKLSMIDRWRRDVALSSLDW